MHTTGLAISALATTATAFVAPSTYANTRCEQSPTFFRPSVIDNRASCFHPSLREPSRSSKSTSALNAGIDPQTFAYAKTAIDLLLSGLAITGSLRISNKIDQTTDNKLARAAGEVIAAATVFLSLNTLSNNVKMIEYVNDDFNRAVIESIRNDPNQDIMHMGSKLKPTAPISDKALEAQLDNIEVLN